MHFVSATISSKRLLQPYPPDLRTHSTRYVKTLVNTQTMPIPKKTVPKMGMIQGTDLYVVNVKMNMPIGVTSAPAMPISNRASGGAFPPFLADSLW
jgi:hypothetical protein